MNVYFIKVNSDDFATMEKDPNTFYCVYDDSSYTLTIGLYKDGVILKTWEELEDLGLDLEKDYSTDPNDPNYTLAPDSGAAEKILDDNGLSGQLVVPNLSKIGNNALANSNGFQGMTTPQAGLASPGTVNVPSSVGSIGEGAFANTGTTQANLPPSVNLAPSAFAGTPAAANNNINMNGHPIQPVNVDLENNDSVAITLEKGYVYQITALYNFKDDVTGESTIVSSNENIVRFIPDCLLRAVDKGHAVISGTYITQLGIKKYAEIECNVVDNGSGVYVHIPGEPVIENETEYTYDEVIYCVDCERELSRVTKYKNPKIYGGVYGAKWLKASDSTWDRTDDATDLADPVPAVNNGDGSSPFDEIMPWKGMERVEDNEAGSLVKIPKYWFKWTKDGNNLQLQISNAPKTGFFVSPAHADRGDGQGERDFVYVGRYHCSSNNYKSKSNIMPKQYESISTCREMISTLGETVWQWDYAMYWTVMMLYLVEYASWDAQDKIGYGCSPNNSMVKTGYTDNMIYHTGTNRANRTTYGGTQYRYIEGLWDNCYDWIDGIIFSDHNVYCENNPATNITFHYGQLIYNSRPYTQGAIMFFNIPSVSGYEYALFPSEISSSNYGYVNDRYIGKSAFTYLYAGSDYIQSNVQGAFCMSGLGESSGSGARGVGSRLMKLPNNS